MFFRLRDKGLKEIRLRGKGLKRDKELRVEPQRGTRAQRNTKDN